MSEFKNFKTAMQKQFSSMAENHSVLFITDVSRDEIWETYLASFPAGTNNLFRERNEYDCNTCRQFLRPYGNVVAINDKNEVVTIWDIKVEGYYQAVADALAAKVRSGAVKELFVSKILKLGTGENHEQTDKGVRTWTHFSFDLPKKFLTTSSDSEEAIMGQFRDKRNVFKRGLDELTTEAVEIVLDLVNQGTVYRGAEHKANLEGFLALKKKYEKIPVGERDNWAWANTKGAAGHAFIRNTSIGTFLQDVSEGRDLDIALSAFERIMAPSNYKRPTAVITKKMIEEAEAKIVELGFENSLARRFSVTEDITVNNVLFANRTTKKKMSGSAFDKLKEEIPDKVKNLERTEEITIEDFIKNVLPTLTSIEMLVENRHAGNFMSLISPEDLAAPSIFKWNNNFSWAYNGDVADSMKENVKKAGGSVDGVLRFSIQWNDKGDNNNDYDAHCQEPGGQHIYFSSKNNRFTGGELDVDIQSPGRSIAVENITWPSKQKMLEGKYKFWVHNYAHRGGTSGFRAELEFDGVIHSFDCSTNLRQSADLHVVEVEYTHKGGFKIVSSVPSTESSREIWGINTNKFTNVSMVMNSPNHWDGEQTGNKHLFFILEGCKNENSPRGFFNEFLNESLTPHRKVFEVLGSKMRVEPSDRQLSGIGVSSTQKNDIVLKVTGSVTRVLKVIM